MYQSRWREIIATEPADLRLRRELLDKLAAALEARMRREALTLRQTAELLEVSHPRIADLLAKRAQRFSLDRLVLYAERLQLTVHLRVTRPYASVGEPGALPPARPPGLD